MFWNRILGFMDWDVFGSDNYDEVKIMNMFKDNVSISYL